MSDPSLQFYPPRAGWNRHFYRAVYGAKRRLHIEDLNLPRLEIEIPAGRFLRCVLLPGFSFYEAGWKRIGQATALAWLAAACVFLLFLGYATANVAFGLMMSMHVSSVLHLLNRALPAMSVLRRIGMSLAVLFVVGQLIYAAGLSWFQSHLFMPLQSGGKVYVVNRLRSIDAVGVGDLVACHAERTGFDGVYIREGYVLDRNCVHKTSSNGPTNTKTYLRFLNCHRRLPTLESLLMRLGGRSATETLLDIRKRRCAPSHRNVDVLDDRRIRICRHRPALSIEFLDEIGGAKFNRRDDWLKISAADENEHKRIDKDKT